MAPSRHLRAKARGHRELVTVTGHAAVISAGEWSPHRSNGSTTAPMANSSRSPHAHLGADLHRRPRIGGPLQGPPLRRQLPRKVLTRASPSVRGCLSPPMQQAYRTTDWMRDNTAFRCVREVSHRLLLPRVPGKALLRRLMPTRPALYIAHKSPPRYPGPAENRAVTPIDLDWDHRSLHPRNGNWKIATRDRSQKPAPQESKCQKLGPETGAPQPNLRECRRFSPTGK
jgi:hypothetical protein